MQKQVIRAIFNLQESMRYDDVQKAVHEISYSYNCENKEAINKVHINQSGFIAKEAHVVSKRVLYNIIIFFFREKEWGYPILDR